MEQEIKKLQEKLAQQQKLASLGLLSAGIAHEIQNPLNFVINFSKMSSHLVDDIEDILQDLSDKIDQEDCKELQDIATDLKENMTKIQEHGQRAISIIQGILLLSRGKEGEKLPTDIPSLLHEYIWLAYHAMRALDKKFNVSIHETYPDNMPKVMIVPQDLSRSILNLANNAFYAVNERAKAENKDLNIAKAEARTDALYGYPEDDVVDSFFVYRKTRNRYEVVCYAALKGRSAKDASKDRTQMRRRSEGTEATIATARSEQEAKEAKAKEDKARAKAEKEAKKAEKKAEKARKEAESARQNAVSAREKVDDYR